MGVENLSYPCGLPLPSFLLCQWLFVNAIEIMPSV
jgi:hypothetical protein